MSWKFRKRDLDSPGFSINFFCGNPALFISKLKVAGFVAGNANTFFFLKEIVLSLSNCSFDKRYWLKASLC